jgi:RNA polymerase sigma-70 factor (ECF subfamily)
MVRMEATDADVVARARDGDNEAFRALVERHSRGLFHLAYRMTGSENDAEDIVQETFLRAYRRLDRFESRAGFGTWLHKIAANCALDLIRARKRHGELLDADAATGEPGGPAATEMLAADQLSAEQLVFGGELQQRVATAMARLSVNERAAFVMRHQEQMSIDEIGRALGLRENATKQSIFRAVQKLRRALGQVAGPARTQT